MDRALAWSLSFDFDFASYTVHSGSPGLSGADHSSTPGSPLSVPGRGPAGSARRSASVTGSRGRPGTVAALDSSDSESKSDSESERLAAGRSESVGVRHCPAPGRGPARGTIRVVHVKPLLPAGVRDPGPGRAELRRHSLELAL